MVYRTYKTDMKKPIKIIAIETSCDETGVAVLKKEGNTVSVLSSALASQIDIHTATGGVVPEIAAREHVVALQTLIPKVIHDSIIDPQTFDAIAVTVGPGLPPALATGVTAARVLAYAWNKPLVPVHHIEGHIYSALLHQENETTYTLPDDSFPALALIVSGGHTQLLLIKNHSDYVIVGQTLDDAAGEAFDKVARLLDLPYPGGPALSRLAEQGNPNAITFPRPMRTSKNLNFSFSGLKTAVLYTWRDIQDKEQQKADVAASFQEAVVDSIVQKTKQALSQYTVRSLLFAGGVAANTRLREKLEDLCHQQKVSLKRAPLALCGDNAIMIGLAGLFALERGRVQSWETVDIQSRFSIDSVA